MSGIKRNSAIFLRSFQVFRSLRSKLIVSFIFVIFLSLLLASAASVFLLREYQTRIRLGQLENIAGTMSMQARLLERAGASPTQIALFLQDQAKEVGVRILLLDPDGMVIEDSQEEMRGQQVLLPSNLQRQNRPVYPFVYRGNDGQNLFLIISGPRPLSSFNERFLNRAPAYSLVLAVPQQSVGSAWLELAPSLSLAAFASLIVSLIVAILLSRSISQPISAITKASEEMARGNYDQSIPVTSNDEIGRMARAFNVMAAEVKASHRTLRDFLANVSHELRTPLTSIQGFSQAMIDGTVKNAEGYAAVGRIINEEAERMRRLVEDLLYLSKIEAGQVPMEQAPVELDALVASCIKKFELQAKLSQIEIVAQLPRLPVIQGDAHRLEQVLINLFDNALKHTPHAGKVTIRASVVSGDAAANTGDELPRFVQLAVHNTGSTIPTQDLDKVFERFYQVDGPRGKQAGGTGLGLAIVKEIVQAHGGFVRVRSGPEDGTEFTVFLPAATAV